MTIFAVIVITLLGWILMDVLVHTVSNKETPTLYNIVGLLVGFLVAYYWILGGTYV